MVHDANVFKHCKDAIHHVNAVIVETHMELKMQQRKKTRAENEGNMMTFTLSSLRYLSRKNEPLAPERLGDFEVLVLQQLVNGILMESQENETPDYENIFKFFKQVMTTARFTNIPSYEKVKKWVDKVISKKSSFVLCCRMRLKSALNEKRSATPVCSQCKLHK